MISPRTRTRRWASDEGNGPSSRRPNCSAVNPATGRHDSDCVPLDPDAWAPEVRKLIPLLRKSASADDPARVINIASIDGMHTSPFSGYAYGTSKAAVIHLTRFMASQHVGEHILVNGIAPGPFPTWMLSTGVGFGGKTEGVDWDSVAKGNPSGRVGTPQPVYQHRAARAEAWSTMAMTR